MSALAGIIEGERLEIRLVNQRNANFTLGKVKEVFKIPKTEVAEVQESRSGASSVCC
jgi:hypothetical protein